MTLSIRFLSLAAALLVLSAVANAGDAKSRASSRVMPSARETIDAFHAAVKAGDVPHATALLLPDLQIYEEGGSERSRAEYVQAHMLEDMAFMKTADVAVLKTDAHIAGKVAWITTETRLRGIAGGQPFDVMTVETAILTRTAAGWRIAHLHWSSRSTPEGQVSSIP